MRLIEAFARGETTKGGMAEAGWFELGRMVDDDGLIFISEPEPS